MAQEIERKFLVKDNSYRRLATSKSRIIQGYISTQRGRTVRVRLRDEQAFLTIKGATDARGMSRYEWEQEIAADDARQLLKLCEPGALIDKVRYLVPVGHHVFEVDEFYGKNAGLVMAEVELDSEDEPFDRPDFLAEEVTGDVRYYNSQLMLHPVSTWDQAPEIPLPEEPDPALPNDAKCLTERKWLI